MVQKIQSIITESFAVRDSMLADEQLIDSIAKVVELVVNAFKNDQKVLFCGNGGSAADAQHLAAELSGRFYLERKPLFAEALHVNSSFLTAVANDYGFEYVFARAIEAAGKKGDVLIALSTSGNSQNLVRAIETASKLNVHVVGLTGENGGLMEGICDILIRVPSADTPRIQECHLLIGHIICELAEAELFSS